MLRILGRDGQIYLYNAWNNHFSNPVQFKIFQRRSYEYISDYCSGFKIESLITSINMDEHGGLRDLHSVPVLPYGENCPYVPRSRLTLKEVSVSETFSLFFIRKGWLS
jgi:hypothetical protein